jgi:hypothetical protein
MLRKPGLSETDRCSAEQGVGHCYSSVARLQASRRYWGVPKIRALVEATYFAGLRKAGMPEE